MKLKTVIVLIIVPVEFIEQFANQKEISLLKSKKIKVFVLHKTVVKILLR